jgi:hypothetical protein
MHPAGFVPAVPAGERPQQYAFDFAAAGFGKRLEILEAHRGIHILCRWKLLLAGSVCFFFLLKAAVSCIVLRWKRVSIVLAAPFPISLSVLHVPSFNADTLLQNQNVQLSQY